MAAREAGSRAEGSPWAGLPCAAAGPDPAGDPVRVVAAAGRAARSGSRQPETTAAGPRVSGHSVALFT